MDRIERSELFSGTPEISDSRTNLSTTPTNHPLRPGVLAAVTRGNNAGRLAAETRRTHGGRGASHGSESELNPDGIVAACL